MDLFGAVTVCLLVVTTALLSGASSPEYKFQTIKTSWYHAEELCKSWGGHLATISSKEENTKIRHQMEIRNMKEAWIGLNDRNKEGAFEWSSNPAHRFMNWMNGEPNGGRGENCVEMLVVNRYWRDYNGQWNDISCNARRSFACEKKSGSRSEYKYYTRKRTWSDAKSTCHSWGGYLLIIESRAENNLLVRGLRARNMEETWIGLNDKHREGIYDWADKHDYLDYVNFQRGEPNGVRGENCVQILRGVSIWFKAYHGQWNDKHCSTKLNSICQKRKEKKARCTGENNGCCTSGTPCDVGEGDCDYDSHCAGSLICGYNNCPWGDHDDCCMKAE